MGGLTIVCGYFNSSLTKLVLMRHCGALFHGPSVLVVAFPLLKWCLVVVVLSVAAGLLVSDTHSCSLWCVRLVEAQPTQPRAYTDQNPQVWQYVQILRIDRVENGHQMEGCALPYFSQLRRTIEVRGTLESLLLGIVVVCCSVKCCAELFATGGISLIS